MNIETLKQAIEIAKLLDGDAAPTLKTEDGRAVIVRSRDAGVQFGYLKAIDGSTVHLTNARQMWSWTAAKGGTLLDCAAHGVSGGRFSTAAPAVIVIGACAVIDVAPDAIKSLESAKWA